MGQFLTESIENRGGVNSIANVVGGWWLVVVYDVAWLVRVGGFVGRVCCFSRAGSFWREHWLQLAAALSSSSLLVIGVYLLVCSSL